MSYLTRVLFKINKIPAQISTVFEQNLITRNRRNENRLGLELQPLYCQTSCYFEIRSRHILSKLKTYQEILHIKSKRIKPTEHIKTKLSKTELLSIERPF